MFTCPACWRNIISSLAADLPGASANRLLRSSQSTHTPRSLRRPGDQSIRTSATLRGLSKGHHRRTALDVLRNPKRTQSLLGNKKRNAIKGSPSYTRAKEANAKQSLTAKGMTKLEIQAQKEAVFLVDPLRLANTVTDHLRQDNFEKAKALVIASDRHALSQGGAPGSANNIVSWNHLMDWLMAKQLPKDAMKLYQDMKKRGHAPDAYTYTILLRGLAENHSKMGDDAATTAVKLYNSIFQPGSGVKTSTLITNAALTVCAKSGDMDALWSIAGRMPETRRGSADHWTYTTVLNAMQNHLLKQMAQAGEGEDAEGLRELAIQKAMVDARMLWREVVKKWRTGDISVDEKLVTAMGRLLLTSGRNLDALDVFELAKQTMGVYVDHQSLRDARKSLDAGVPIPEQDPDKVDSPENDDSSNLTDNAIAGRGAHIFHPVVEAGQANQPVEGEDNPYQPLSAGNKSTLVKGVEVKHAVFARPGTNTLSMLLQAATNLKKAHIGKVYWELLTNPAGAYSIEPDTQNCMAYLRLLRQARSSQSALEMLQQPWTGAASDFLRKRGAYVIAMSTCIRNKLNPNIFTIASRMLDVMQDKAAEFREAREDQEQQELSEQEQSATRRSKSLEVRSLDMDPRVLTMYLELAMHTTKGLTPLAPLRKMPSGDLDYERDPTKNNTMRALHRLGPDIVNLSRMVKLMREELAFIARHASVPAAAQRKMKLGTRVGEKAQDLLDFLKMVVSATDRILHVNYRLEEDGMGPLDNSTVMDVRIRRAKMTSYIETLSKAMGLQIQEKSGKPREGAAASARRERPLSKRQKQEKERERRNQSLLQEMVSSGKTEREVRQGRAERVQKKPRFEKAPDLWGHDTGASYNETFTELRS